MAGSDLAAVKRLFHEIVDLPDEAARRARLAELDAPPELAARALALAEADQRQTRAAASVAGVLAGMSGGAPGQGSELKPGDRLGPWLLTAELGRGGMGRVFAAERSDGLYRQKAAIKLLAGWHGPEALARLARERQILASLSHPHIARLLEGGTTPLGRPYLAMDFVDGQPIDAWVTQHRAGPAEVVRLLREVADAVAHAHRQLVVHCDLKPANVLVTAEGRAVLLDFGIAQLASEGEGTAAFTPRYASPEQRAGQPPTTASDVYGLGVMAGELLDTARAPRAREWRAVVARATADDPARRYEGAQALVRDLERWLAHHPVAALPATPGYWAGRLLRRQWPWALALSLATVGAAGFTLRLVQERDRALAAERQAQVEAARARAVTGFVVDLFEDADPRQAGRPDLPAAELLARGRERVARDLAEQPELRATLQQVLGQAFVNLGRPRDGEVLLDQAAAQARAAGDALREARALNALAMLRMGTMDMPGAEAAARRALALRETALPPDDAERADALNTLGVVLTQTRHLDESRRHLEQALVLRRARFGETSAEVAATLHNLGQLAVQRGDGPAGEAWYRQSLAVKARLFDDRHMSRVNSLYGLAQALSLQRRPDDALPVLEEVRTLRVARHGEVSDFHAEVLGEMLVAMHDAGRLTEGRALLPRVLDLSAATEGADSMQVAVALNNGALLLADAGAPDEAEAALRRSLAIRRARQGDDSLAAARAEHNLGRLLLARGALAEAVRLVDTAAGRRERQRAPGHPDRLDSLLLQAELRLAQGRVDDAAARVADYDAQAGAHPQPRHAIARLRLQALLAQARGDAGAAVATWRSAAEAAAALPAGHPQRVAVEVALAAAELAAGEHEPARRRLAALQPRWAGYGDAAPVVRQARRLAAALPRA
jgi:serine/threonine-protein kinase